MHNSLRLWDLICNFCVLQNNGFREGFYVINPTEVFREQGSDIEENSSRVLARCVMNVG